MIRLLGDCIAVRPIHSKPTPLQAAPVETSKPADAADKSAETDGTAVSESAGGESTDGGVAAKASATPSPSPAPAPRGIDPRNPRFQQEEPRARRLGKVVGVGPGRLSTAFSSWPLPEIPIGIKIGDTVMLPEIMPAERIIDDEGQESFIVHADYVLAVIDPDPAEPPTVKTPFAPAKRVWEKN